MILQKNLTRQLYYNNIGITVSNYSGTIKKYGTTAYIWWLRSAHSYDYYDFYTVIRSGDLSDASAYGICVISPAFRIG